MAQPTVPPNPFPAQGRVQLTITAEEISKYPEIGAFALPFESWGVCSEGVAAVGQARASCARSGEDQEESMRSPSTGPKTKRRLVFNHTELPDLPGGAASY
jgi:hypothetical protein